jgi:hypothetical protein
MIFAIHVIPLRLTGWGGGWTSCPLPKEISLNRPSPRPQNFKKTSLVFMAAAGKLPSPFFFPAAAS